MALPANRLEAEIKQLLDDEGVILLEFNASGHAGRLALRVLADRRQDALTIDDCVHLSRQIQHLIREKNLLNDDYRLEVGSPGMDYPLREMWQYAKNINRLLKLRIPGEKGPKEISGRLMVVDDEGIVLISDKTEWKLRFGDILRAHVLPELKPPRME